MKIQIMHYPFDHMKIIENYISHSNNESISVNNQRHVDLTIKKLIREQHLELNLYPISLDIKCPLLLYYKIYSILPKNCSDPCIVNPMSFETNYKFTDIENNNMISIYKKILEYTKNIDPDKLIYFIPMSCNVKFYINISLLELYSFLNILKISKEQKTKDFYNDLIVVLSKKDPKLFSMYSIDL